MFHPSPIFARAWILAFFVAPGGGGILWMSHSWKRRSWNRCDAIRWGSPCDRCGGRPTPWGEVVTCRTEMFCDFCQEVRLLGGVGVENNCLQLYWCSFTIWLSAINYYSFILGISWFYPRIRTTLIGHTILKSSRTPEGTAFAALLHGQGELVPPLRSLGSIKADQMDQGGRTRRKRLLSTQVCGLGTGSVLCPK
jgi:hypothetical protein